MRIPSIAVLVVAFVLSGLVPARSAVTFARATVRHPDVKIGTIPLAGDPNQMTNDSSGNVWFGTSTDAKDNIGFLGVLDPKTYGVTTYTLNYGGVSDDEPSHPHLGTNGLVYFMITSQGTAPSVLGSITPAGNISIYSNDLVAEGLDVFSSDTIISDMTSAGTAVAFATENGSYYTVPVPVPPGYATASGIGPKAGPNGDIWYCQTLTGPDIGGVGAMTRKGRYVVNIPLGPDRCQELAYGPDGNLWTGDPANGELLRITPKGRLTDFRNAMNVSQPRPDPVDDAIWFVSSTGSQASIDEFQIDTKTLTPYAIPAMPSGDTVRGVLVDHTNNSIWFSEAGSTPVNALFRLQLR